MRKLIRRYHERQYRKLSHRLDDLLKLESQIEVENQGRPSPLGQRVAEKRARVANKRYQVARKLDKETT